MCGATDRIPPNAIPWWWHKPKFLERRIHRIEVIRDGSLPMIGLPACIIKHDRPSLDFCRFSDSCGVNPSAQTGRPNEILAFPRPVGYGLRYTCALGVLGHL